jgi:ectoine hydroxylase
MDELILYDTNGYLVLHDFVDRRSIEVLRAASNLRRAASTQGMNATGVAIAEDGADVVRSVFAVHEDGAAFEAFMSLTTLGDAARQILADEVYIHQSRINYKPAFDGKGFAWHSDFETWHHEDAMPAMRALSVVVFLSPNRASNGPLMVIPGSHKVFVPCVGETPEDNHLRSLVKQEVGVPSRSVVASLERMHGIDVITGGPGTVVLFDANMLHASCDNVSPLDRTNLFYVYNAVSNAPIEKASMKRPSYLAGREATSERAR